MADWLATLKKQRELAGELAREVPRTLAAPELTLEQAGKLYQALERQAQFMERLVSVLEQNGFDFDVVGSAEKLEDVFQELAADAAERIKAFRDSSG